MLSPGCRALQQNAMPVGGATGLRYCRILNVGRSESRDVLLRRRGSGGWRANCIGGDDHRGREMLHLMDDVSTLPECCQGRIHCDGVTNDAIIGGSQKLKPDGVGLVPGFLPPILFRVEVVGLPFSRSPSVGLWLQRQRGYSNGVACTVVHYSGALFLA